MVSTLSAIFVSISTLSIFFVLIDLKLKINQRLRYLGIINILISTFYLIYPISASNPTKLIFETIILGTTLFIVYTLCKTIIDLITYNYSFNNKLKAAYQETEEARSILELGKSIAMINHELKNYIFTIRNGINYIKKHSSLSDKCIKISDETVKTVDGLAQFSDDILNFSKSKIIKKKEPIEIKDIIDKCITQHFPNQKDQFSIYNANNNKIIFGNITKLEHVFINLFKNAFEANSSDITIKIIHNKAELLIYIEDDGLGCDSEEIDNMFKAFHTTKSGGTGLGMSIIQSIIEAHGGHIIAKSKNLITPDETGLIFFISLPVFEAK